jgi:FKBP-type peptidyl-prolyl cis-trans isomerase FkpA
MQRKSVLICISLLFLFSCKEQKIPGFRRMDNGSYIKLIALGESDRKAKPGEYMELELYNTFADSVLYDSRLESPSGTVLLPFSEKDGFSKLREGDSAVFLLPAYDLMPYGKDSMMHMQVKLIHVLDEQQYKLLSERQELRNEENEQKILTCFLKRTKQKFQNIHEGIYYLEEKTGKGKNVEQGDKVLLNYQGTFLNGKKFDVTNEPVEFAIGDEGQLLEGMSLGLARMKEGGKAKFVISSPLAYGSEGSSTGIVKPFTTIVYEVELLKIN